MSTQKDFDEIYRLYAADVYRFILRLCQNETLAADILQDTMLKAFTESDKYRGECEIKTWLCAIARNAYRDHLKKAENKNLQLDESWDIPDESSMTDKLEDKAQALQLHRLLHGLEDPFKEVFSLRVFAELSFKEIGGVFGQSENWARVTFFRAKKKLIQLFEKEEA